MNPILHAVWPIAAYVIVMGTVIAWDRLRELRRDLRRPFAIGGRRDMRDAARRVDRLIAEADWLHAWEGCVAICTWLSSERHFQRGRRRREFEEQLATWQARRSELCPLIH